MTNPQESALRRLHVCPLLIRLLIHFYSNIRGKVKWNGFYSNEFPISNGVKQGGVISPILFALYIDVLINLLKEKAFGCRVGNKCSSIFAYADDVILLAPTISEMRRMLKMCEIYCIDYGLKLNVEKSEILLFGDFKTNELCFFE